MYIAIKNCDWQDAIYKQTVSSTRSAFVINKRRCFRLTDNQVSVALIASADACMQGVQGSNPTDD